MIISITPKKESSLAQLSNLSINYKVEERRVNLYGDLTSQIPAIFITEVLSEMIFKSK
ncbi:HTH-type transcriptional regulator [Lactococcus cremoris]|nr:HTH-type transcriptional regulator [Lactococcus cremoris]